MLAFPFYVIVIGIAMVVEYQDRYGMLRSFLQDNPFYSYLLVWPPLVLLVTLSDMFLLSTMFPRYQLIFFTVALTLLGIIGGYSQRRVNW